MADAATLPEIVVTPPDPAVTETPAPAGTTVAPSIVPQVVDTPPTGAGASEPTGLSGPTQPVIAPVKDPTFPGFDPYDKNADAQQSLRRRAYCIVKLDGRDITPAIEPFLISLRIADGETDFECELELDDRDGRLDIPAVGGSTIEASIGWESESFVTNFRGAVAEVEHSGSRDTGRHMTVRANGNDSSSKLKQPTNNYLGAGAPPGQEMGLPMPFKMMAEKVIGGAGGKVSMHPKIANAMSDYWAQMNESPLHFATRYARELGGKMRVQDGNHVVMHIPGEGVGTGSTTVTATWGRNLIAWRVHPVQAKSMWAGANQQWFSFLSGQWIEMAKKFGGSLAGISQAAARLPNAAPNSQVAGNQTGGQEQVYQGQSDTGRIVMNGEPRASAVGEGGTGGNVIVENVRPGVDGTYIITMAEHVYNRSGGYVTNLTVHRDGNASGSANVLSKGYEATFRSAEPSTSKPIQDFGQPAPDAPKATVEQPGAPAPDATSTPGQNPGVTSGF